MRLVIKLPGDTWARRFLQSIKGSKVNTGRSIQFACNSLDDNLPSIAASGKLLAALAYRRPTRENSYDNDVIQEAKKTR